MHISVIIPYYQKTPGLLRASVDSILKQDVNATVQIIVVDDESPHSAKAELADLDLDDNRILLLQQKNSGPGVARNAGLDLVPDETDYVAFLDSDDIWTVNHLQRAIDALEKTESCLFFEDVQLAEKVNLFNKGNVPETLHQYSRLDGTDIFHVIDDDWHGLVLNGCVLTSSVVARHSDIEHLQFSTTYYRSGEDQKMWLDICSQNKGIVFSLEVGAIYGNGVNIYSGQVWGKQSSVDTLNHEIKFRKHLLKENSLPNKWKIDVRKRLHNARYTMITNLAHMVRRGNLKVFLVQVFDDPLLAVYFTKFLLKQLINFR